MLPLLDARPAPWFRARALAAAIAAALVMAPAAPAVAGSGCSAELSGWVRGCRERAGMEVSVVACPPGLLIVSASRDGVTTRFQIEGGEGRGFRTAGQVSISPIGDFASWADQPEPRRRSLDAVAACALAALPILAARPSDPPRPPPEHVRPPPPWRLLGGALIGAVALLVAARGRLRRALVSPAAAALAALAALTWLGRRALFPHGFFHPNGQGPLWVALALDDRPEPSDYGPGFREIFHALAAGSPRPEAAIFLAQSLASALAPPLGYLLARAVGARPALAAAVALFFALDPALGRLAGSASYYGTAEILLLAAAAILAEGARRSRVRRPELLLAAIAAGLLAAQAARVHPIAWAAACLVPLAAFPGAGSSRARLRAGAAAAVTMGAVLLAAAGPAALAVLQGPLGPHWLPRARALHADLPAPLVLLVLALSAIVARTRPHLRAWSRVALLVVTVLACALTGLVRLDGLPFRYAYAMLFAPVAAAALVGLLARLAPGRAAAAALAVMTLVWAAALHRPLAPLATPALESAWAEEWRERLPRGSTVAHLARVEPRLEVLPLYGAFDPRALTARGLDASGPLPDPGELARGGYWYRSSLCALPEGAAFCDEVERALVLEPIARRDLPAIPGRPDQRYPGGTVSVALFRILGVRGG